MNLRASIQHSHIAARNVRPILVSPDDVRRYADLRGIGINIGDREIQQMINELAPTMDSVQSAPFAPLNAASITTPIQFLQTWLPGFVRVLTAARKIDTLIGISTVGAWDDEEIVQGIMEPVGNAELYSDTGNIPLSSYQTAFERRTVIRFEKGISVGNLEEARAARMRVSTATEKRTSASLALEISRNRVGFYGFASGNNRTFGFLNDPGLPAYATVPVGASTTTPWSGKTFLEIIFDIRAGAAALQTGSGDNISPEDMSATLAVATASYQYLSVTNTLGTQSVRAWIKETYPNWRIESAPELNAANGGANVFYLFAESVDDGASDDSRTFVQVVPAKFLTLGVEKRSKVYIEDYSNATAGTLCKRPYAVYRASGI